MSFLSFFSRIMCETLKASSSAIVVNKTLSIAQLVFYCSTEQIYTREKNNKNNKLKKSRKKNAKKEMKIERVKKITPSNVNYRNNFSFTCDCARKKTNFFLDVLFFFIWLRGGRKMAINQLKFNPYETIRSEMRNEDNEREINSQKSSNNLKRYTRTAMVCLQHIRHLYGYHGFATFFFIRSVEVLVKLFMTTIYSL